MKLTDIFDFVKNFTIIISTILAILLVFSDPEQIDRISQLVLGSLLKPRVILFIVAILTAYSTYAISKWFYSRKLSRKEVELSKVDEIHKEELNLEVKERLRSVEKSAVEMSKVEERLENEIGEHRKTKLKLENFRKHVYEIRREQLTDLITGIPNDRMLRVDLKNMIDNVEHGQQIQLIFIDLDGFKKINDNYSYYTGDELIKLIAQSLYNGMRRNEVIYKKTFIEEDDVPLTKSVYRKYTGGDEFIILIRGKQYDAVGLLNRISDNFKELSQIARSKLEIDVDLKFKAVILQIFSADGFSDEYYDILWDKEISQGLRKIKQEEFPLKVYWNRDKEAKEKKLDSFALNIYDRARERFKK